MRELLERWAELEPERCQLAGNFACVVLIQHVWRRVRYDANIVDDRPRVLWAVIEAATARDWYFDISYLPGPKQFHADVVLTLHRGKTTDPAEALLSAYIKALEAVKPG